MKEREGGRKREGERGREGGREGGRKGEIERESKGSVHAQHVLHLRYDVATSTAPTLKQCPHSTQHSPPTTYRRYPPRNMHHPPPQTHHRYAPLLLHLPLHLPRPDTQCQYTTFALAHSPEMCCVGFPCAKERLPEDLAALERAPMPGMLFFSALDLSLNKSFTCQQDTAMNK